VHRPGEDEMNNQQKRISSIITDPPNSCIMESGSMFDVLYKELAYIEQRIKDSPKDQRLRRIYIRSLFAMVESCIFRMKQDAMAIKKDFSPEEILLLKETRGILDDSGRVKKANDHIRTLPNLRFAFEAYTKALGINFKLNVADHRWDAFKNALETRHSLTHPKHFLDLVITDPDWQIVVDAGVWFLSQLNEMKKEIDSKFGTRGKGSS
jgi:hypothetical protein